MTIENCGLPSGPRTIAVGWHSYHEPRMLTLGNTPHFVEE